MDLPGRGAIGICISRLPLQRGFGRLKEMGAPSEEQGRAMSRKQGIRARRLLARAPPSAAGQSRAGAAGGTLQGGVIPDPALAAPSAPRPCRHVLPGLLPWDRQGPGWPRRCLLLNQTNRECFNGPFSSRGQAPSRLCQGLDAGGRGGTDPGHPKFLPALPWDDVGSLGRARRFPVPPLSVAVPGGKRQRAARPGPSM